MTEVLTERHDILGTARKNYFYLTPPWWGQGNSTLEKIFADLVDNGCLEYHDVKDGFCRWVVNEDNVSKRVNGN